MLWSRPGNISAEIDLEWLLKAMPASEAALYRVLIQLIPAPSAEAPNLARRQIKLEVLAKLTGFTKRWVIELLPRLEEKDLIRTEGGSGTVKWIWRLPLGVPRLGKSFPTELTQKKTTSPGQAKAPRVAASQPKRRPKETAPSAKPDADVKVEPPAEKPAEIPARRREEPMPSIPPVGPAADNPAAPATMVTQPPLHQPIRRCPPPMLTPAPSVARGPAPGNPVVPAAVVTSPPVVPAKRVPRRRSTKKLPTGRSHWESAPIEELVAYACSQPVILRDLKVPGMTEHLLLLALERLCQRMEHYGLMPCQDRWELISTLRTILSDL